MQNLESQKKYKMERSNNWISILLKNVSLIMFVAILGVLYIANVHVAERKQMRIERLKKDVQKKKWEYMGIEKDLLLNSSPSRIEKKMNELGLKYSTKRPVRLSLEEEVKKEP